MRSSGACPGGLGVVSTTTASDPSYLCTILSTYLLTGLRALLDMSDAEIGTKKHETDKDDRVCCRIRHTKGFSNRPVPYLLVAFLCARGMDRRVLLM